MQEHQNQFNASLSYLDLVMKIIEGATIAKTQGNTIAHFRNLELVYITTHPFYDDDEKKELRESILKIENLLETHHNQAGIWVGENMCDRLHERLIALLFKYKIIYTQLKTQTWQDKVRDDFS